MNIFDKVKNAKLTNKSKKIVLYGKITSYNFPLNDKLQARQLVGAAQIIDFNGNVLERKEFTDGEGLIFSDISPNSLHLAADIDFNRYWIPNLPEPYIKAWNEVNPLGSKYYEEYMLPYYLCNYNNYL